MDQSNEDGKRQRWRIKLRTITLFAPDLRYDDGAETWYSKLTHYLHFLNYAQESFRDQLGLEIQTVRISSSFLASILHGREDSASLCSPSLIRTIIQRAKQLEDVAKKTGITFLSLGSMPSMLTEAFLSHQGALAALASVLSVTSFSVPFHDVDSRGHGGWDRYSTATRLTREILWIADGGCKGASFRFGVSFNCCGKGIPFFPCSSADDDGGGGDQRGFALGCENNRLLYEAFCSAMRRGRRKASDLNEVQRPDLDDVMKNVHSMFTSELLPVQEGAERISNQYRLTLANELQFHVPYIGMDSSIVPSLDPPSIADAFETLHFCSKFGGTGTLAVAERLTATLKALPLRLTGYCGLMLPICEDPGLASAATDGRLTLSSLLQYSAVCGVGLDTVPIPGTLLQNFEKDKLESWQINPFNNKIRKCGDLGKVEAENQPRDSEDRLLLEERVAALILDVSALSNRLNRKPLSMRLLPVPGAAVGDRTSFDNPYLVESHCMAVR